jgi:hypothetical protein
MYGYGDYIKEQQPAGVLLVFNSEVDRWINQPCLPLKSTPKHVKGYIQSKAYEFPLITQIARDFMAIPVTLATSERVFSIAGNSISKKRTRIASENVRYVLCLWSRGLLVKDNDEIEVIINKEGRIIQIVPVVG